jgi:hypothetical protein
MSALDARFCWPWWDRRARAGARAPLPRGSRGGSRSGGLRVQDDVRAALEKEGIGLDLAAGVLSIPATVQIRSELLEYLLVGPNGAAHESLFLTRVRPSLLNAALLLLGVESGHNARWEEGQGVDELGRPQRTVHPPEGDGFYLYAAWREQGETYFFRVEDLVRNLESGRTLRRHRWVYLGSRFAALRPGQPEIFVADAEGNLINLSFFFQGNTLLTAAPEECLAQTIWAANEWLIPEQGEPVRLFFARRPLERLEPAWAAALPEAGATGQGAEVVPGARR